MHIVFVIALKECIYLLVGSHSYAYELYVGIKASPGFKHLPLDLQVSDSMPSFVLHAVSHAFMEAAYNSHSWSIINI